MNEGPWNAACLYENSIKVGKERDSSSWTNIYIIMYTRNVALFLPNNLLHKQALELNTLTFNAMYLASVEQV